MRIGGERAIGVKLRMYEVTYTAMYGAMMDSSIASGMG